jgi:hypothetical protein
MIAQILVGVVFIGCFAMYIAFVASIFTKIKDNVVCKLRNKYRPELVHYYCCDPWGQ